MEFFIRILVEYILLIFPSFPSLNSQSNNMNPRTLILDLPHSQANLWEEITTSFGFAFSRNGQKVAARATDEDFRTCWTIMGERFPELRGTEIPNS